MTLDTLAPAKSSAVVRFPDLARKHSSLHKLGADTRFPNLGTEGKNAERTTLGSSLIFSPSSLPFPSRESGHRYSIIAKISDHQVDCFPDQTSVVASSISVNLDLLTHYSTEHLEMWKYRIGV